ncbi:polysaccharide deacetylase family protein [Streptomyces sp. NPDC058308]|uniref:polysaccharide deacetylase family protein n=1 Tax=Streptomyces sp. NPDC058308 TaxID=3346440 RepID=UPI0036E4D8CA
MDDELEVTAARVSLSRAAPFRRRTLAAALFGFAGAGAVLAGLPDSAAQAASGGRDAGSDQPGLPSLFGSENRVMRTRERVMAVTFNAAWGVDGLGTVLGELTRRHLPATFFLTGDFADRHPEAVRRIALEGHGLGNHSYSHPYFKDLTAAGRAREVRAADKALRTAGAGRNLPPFFRFPYSATSPAHIKELNALGFADIEFTADTNGWKGAEGGMTVERAVGRALDALRPGLILQMHVGTPTKNGIVIDAGALPRILDGAVARGYRVIDLRTLLTRPAPARGRAGERARS